MSALPRSRWRAAGTRLIGEFRVLPAANEIRGPAGAVRLRPLLMDVLLRLAAEPGEVVARERLIEDVWPRRMVNDEVLSRAIAELRTALGDDPRQPRYVETIPKSGYRLVAPVREADAPTGASPPHAAGRRRLATVAIAIAVLAIAGAALFLRDDPAAGLAERLATAQPFTADPQFELGPRFSPDGARLAFVLGEGAASRIVVQPAEGGARRLIGEEGAVQLSPVFFPDGRRIAYWRQRDGDCAIVEHDLDSGAERRLLDCALRPRSRFDLSPDGKRLAVTSTVEPAGLALVDLASGTATPFTRTGAGESDDVSPRFSPDGAQLAFFRGNASHRSLWVARTDDPAGARRASPLEGLTYGAAWLGRDGPLLVAADWLGFRALTLVDLDTGKVRLLGARGARYPDANPAGDVAWENAVFQANLWLLDPARPGEAPRPLWPSTRYTNMPAFSPDGRSVAFVSNRDGLEGVYVAALDGEPVRLPLPREFRYIRPHWSPDGRSLYAVRIAVGTARPAQQHAVRITVADGRVQVLEGLGSAVAAVAPSADGRWLYASEVAGEAARLVRAPATDPSAVERLALPPVAEFQLNATHLVYTRPGVPGATRCRLEDLACEPLAIALDDAIRYDWVLGADAIYFPDGAPGRRQLARFDLAEGRIAWRRDFAPTASGLAIAPSPDGKRLVVSREDRPAIDLMIARAAR